MHRRGRHNRRGSAGRRRSNLDEVNVRRRKGTQKEIYDVDFDKRSVGYFEPINDNWKVTHSGGVTYLESPGDAIEFLVEKGAEAKAGRVANRARREHIDLVTGTRVRPGTRGAVETGRYVMRVRPEKGEPFEVVVVESEDLDPARDVLGIAPALRGYYQEQARLAAKAGKKEAKESERRRKRLEKRKIKGVRGTFTTPREGAEELYEENTFFYMPIHESASDPGDFLDRWFDTNEVRVGKRWRPLRETKRGQELEQMHYRAFGREAIVQALAYVLGKTKNRRWEDVDWDSIDTYNDALTKAYYEARLPVAGWTAFQLPLAARGLPSEEEAIKASPELQEQFMWAEAHDELSSVADQLDKAYKQNRKHIKDAAARKTIRERIKQVRAWAEDPRAMPEWACKAGQVYCDFPGPWQELREIQAAPERPYDPNWPLRELAAGQTARDLGIYEGVVPAGAPAAAPVEEDLDLPWEVTAANPRQVNFGKLKRRLLR